MNRHHWLTALALTAAVAFASGTLASDMLRTRTVSAQADVLPPRTLPPIFSVGNIVTFGPQGPRLTVLAVYGDWVFVSQNRDTATTNPVDTNNDVEGRFWLNVPGIHESWRLYEE